MLAFGCIRHYVDSDIGHKHDKRLQLETWSDDVLGEEGIYRKLIFGRLTLANLLKVQGRQKIYTFSALREIHTWTNFPTL